MAVQDITYTPEELQNEEWRAVPVKPLCGLYEVSNLGRVRRTQFSRRAPAGHILKQPPDKLGYKVLRLKINGRKLTVKVHHLVTAAFIGPRPSGLVINHLDTNPSNNRIGNLEYVTQKENMAHASRLGRMRHGESSTKSKLTDSDVREMRGLHADGATVTQLARRFSLNHGSVSRILRGHFWKHVT